VEIAETQQPCAFVIDPRRPGNSLIEPLRKALKDKGLNIEVLTPNTLETAAACGRFYDATGDVVREDDDGIRIFHLGQPELDRALGAAKRLDQGSGGAFTFVNKTSAGNLSPLYGVVLAMLGSDEKGGNSYDVLDSVDSGRPCTLCGRSVYRHDEKHDDGPPVTVWLHAVDDTPECGT